MAGILRKLISGADFWDKEENRRQREEFAKQREEERRRKREQQARAKSSFSSMGPSDVPPMLRKPSQVPNTIFDPTSPLSKVGSQSKVQAEQEAVQTPAGPVAPKKAPVQQEFLALKKGEEKQKKLFGKNAAWLLPKSLEKQREVTTNVVKTDKDTFLTGFDNVGKEYKDIIINNAKKKSAEGDAVAASTLKLLEETGRTKKSIVERGGELAASPGRSIARVGTGIAQGGSGIYDLATPGKGTSRTSKFLDKSAKTLDRGAVEDDTVGLYKTGNVAGEVASLFIPGVGLSKASKVAEGTKLAGGLTKATSKVDDIAKLIDKGGDAGKIRKILAKAVRRGLDPKEVLEEVAQTSKYTGENASKGRDTNPSSVAGDLAMGVGGNAVTGVLGAGGRGLLKKFNKEAEQNIDEVIEEVGDIAKKGEDAPTIPGTTERKKIPLTRPKIEIAPGIMSHETIPTTLDVPNPGSAVDEAVTNVPEVPTVQNIPNPASNRPLAKVGSEIPEEAAAPIANFNEALNGSLKKAAPAPEPVSPRALETVYEERYGYKPNSADLGQMDPEVYAELENAARARGPVSIEEPVQATDMQGNAALVSDVDARKQMIEDTGVVPDQQGASPVVAQEEELARQAEQAVQDQVNLEGKQAPRTSEQLLNNVEDPTTRANLAENSLDADPVNLDEAKQAAAANVNSKTDEELAFDFRSPKEATNPVEFNEALAVMKRLEGINTPEAQTAASNAFNAMQAYSSKSGLGLRATQVAWDDMPSSMKHSYLLSKLPNAGVDLPDVDRELLLNSIQTTDNVARAFSEKQAQMNKLLDDAAIGVELPEGAIRNLADELDAARVEKELAAGDTLDLYKSYKDKPNIGARIGETGRALMLSSPFGRLFDLLSTGATATSDLATRKVSSLLGKGVNQVKGAGTVIDTGPKLRKILKGTGEGIDDFRMNRGQGRRRVEDFIKAEKAVSSRGDIGGTGKLSKALQPYVEAPTDFTRGLETEKLYALGRQEGEKLGLVGEQLEDYSVGRAAAPTPAQLEDARMAWDKANMLHENAVSRRLNTWARNMDENGNRSWQTVLIRNQIAPFTSWLGGNINRTLTDKNVLWNIGSAIRNVSKGNTQGFVDDLAKFTVNTGEAFALGLGLTKAGIITDTDANGDSYGGLYFHIGDRYIPVAAAGTMSVPLIFGNSLSKGIDTMQEGGDFADGLSNAMANGVTNLAGSTGVSSVFGGDNNLQSTIADTAAELRKPAEDRSLNPAISFFGDLGRQYIPSATGDVNSILDQTALNPTGEAAETKVMEEGSNRTNVFATEIAKTKARIPGLAQGLDRREGTLAKDPIDRMTKGNRESGEMAEARVVKQSVKDLERELKANKVMLTDDGINAHIDDGDYDKAIQGLGYKLAKAEADPEASKSSKQKIKDKIFETQLKSEGVSVTEEGIKARTEEGDYDKAIRGLEYKLDLAERDNEKSASYKRKIGDQITRLKVTETGDYPPEVISLYSKISNSQWKKMGDADSEDYDPDLYNLLYSYDQALTAEGVSLKEDDGTKPKYAAKGSGSGGRGGGRGGKGGEPSIVTKIATQTAPKSFSPQKAQAATFGAPDSPIPVLVKVANYDKSKLKKISVTRGGKS